MRDCKSYELIDTFVKTRAEKYRSLAERNEYVQNRIDGVYKPTREEIDEYNDQFNKCSELALEGEARVNSFINKLKVFELNQFMTLVKKYSKYREKEIDDLSVYMLPSFDEKVPIEKIEYYEMYERPSIKDLIYLIARAKGRLFGMSDEEAFAYASHEMEQLIDIDILGISLGELREKVKIRD